MENLYNKLESYNSQGVIKEIQEKAQKLFGTGQKSFECGRFGTGPKSFILVNGSTCGLLAGIRAVVKPRRQNTSC